ncbi:MAG: TIGR01777 family protein [Planctomycetes bacterium]|nr:TIGR01777 family protein [Planctomycetota bacterium]
MNQRILITGGTGFVGTRLRQMIVDRGGKVVVATRNPANQPVMAGVEYVTMPTDLSGFDAIVNLAGEPVLGKRWSDAVKARIRGSRIDGTRKLVDAFKASATKPKVLVNASAIGVYGDQGERLLPESAKAGVDFLAEVCTAWEREAERASELGVRVVKLRIGIVLGAGGALKQMLPPFKLGLGGPIGSGAHWMSWIHIDDLCGLILHALRDETVSGPMNGVAPLACTNRDFSKALGRALSRPAIFPVPPFMLKLMFGSGAASVLIGSQRCVPERALESGYAFKYPDLDGALRAILS